MKKICITAFCIVILFVAVSVILPSAASNSYIRGDTDCDGVVTICDVTEIQRSLADLATPSFDKRAADVNGDGLNISDATQIQRYLAEYENIYHIGETVTVTEPTTRDSYELPFVPNY